MHDCRLVCRNHITSSEWFVRAWLLQFTPQLCSTSSNCLILAVIHLIFRSWNGAFEPRNPRMVLRHSALQWDPWVFEDERRRSTRSLYSWRRLDVVTKETGRKAPGPTSWCSSQRTGASLPGPGWWISVFQIHSCLEHWGQPSSLCRLHWIAHEYVCVSKGEGEYGGSGAVGSERWHASFPLLQDEWKPHWHLHLLHERASVRQESVGEASWDTGGWSVTCLEPLSKHVAVWSPKVKNVKPKAKIMKKTPGHLVNLTNKMKPVHWLAWAVLDGQKVQFLTHTCWCEPQCEKIKSSCSLCELDWPGYTFRLEILCGVMLSCLFGWSYTFCIHLIILRVSLHIHQPCRPLVPADPGGASEPDRVSLVQVRNTTKKYNCVAERVMLANAGVQRRISSSRNTWSRSVCIVEALNWLTNKHQLVQ